MIRRANGNKQADESPEREYLYIPSVAGQMGTNKPVKVLKGKACTPKAPKQTANVINLSY
ncbi:hypothetical protein HMPREF1981_02489 [Bacteroides pyogenes F0041]|uniref:Uncharacterized protein n=1 Tax=Bacteroides pyogenes F0041 TaxID=1321819 RepID=U2CI21_9BACE|nr:hypothetical protein HMPREF1981_02489 [Bacteroides pyogenes F0041]